jgi:hypothetical protein
MQPKPPHVSRETRLLLTVALASVVSLWVLARIRFPDRETPPNPVAPVLAQLAPRPTFEDLAAAIGDVRTRVAPSLVPVRLVGPAPGAGVFRRAALRFREELGVVILDDESRLDSNELEVVAHDAVTTVAVVRLPARMPARLPVWTPRRLTEPRYFVAADVSAAGAALRPVFVGALSPIDSPLWPAPIWAVSASTDVTNGTFILTSEGAVAGVAVAYDGGIAIVPAAVLLGVAEGLAQNAPPVAGQLGIAVQAMTPELAEAVGAASGLDLTGPEGTSSVLPAMAGVIVSWVDPDGPSAGRVQVADVIEAVGEHAISSVEHWRAQALRLADGQMIALTVRRGGERHRVELTAKRHPGPPAAATQPLGLTLRGIPGVGAMVVEVERGSSAARAGLASGDIVTQAGAVAAPSPAQVRRQFAAQSDRPLIVSFRRGDNHQVTALRKRW